MDGYLLGVQREGRETRRGNSCGRLNTFERKSSHARDDGLDLVPIKRRRSTTPKNQRERGHGTWKWAVRRMAGSLSGSRRRLNAVNPVARSASGNFFLFPPPTRSLHSFHLSLCPSTFLSYKIEPIDANWLKIHDIPPLILESFYHNTTIWKTIALPPSRSSFPFPSIPFRSFFPRLFLQAQPEFITQGLGMNGSAFKSTVR